MKTAITILVLIALLPIGDALNRFMRTGGILGSSCRIHRTGAREKRKLSRSLRREERRLNKKASRKGDAH